MKKRKVTLKSWLVKVLSTILVSYIVFLSLTIESIGNKTYNTILVVYTILGVGSFYLLKKFSSVLD